METLAKRRFDVEQRDEGVSFSPKARRPFLRVIGEERGKCQPGITLAIQVRGTHVKLKASANELARDLEIRHYFSSGDVRKILTVASRNCGGFVDPREATHYQLVDMTFCGVKSNWVYVVRDKAGGARRRLTGEKIIADKDLLFGLSKRDISTVCLHAAHAVDDVAYDFGDDGDGVIEQE